MRFLFFALFLASRLSAAGVDFLPSDLSAARRQAQNEGKMLLVNFHSNKAPACQIMEQETWSDPALASFMSDKCVAVRLDVESIEGQLFRDYFHVEKAPTLLLLNACGSEISRQETVLNVTRLVRWVSHYNNDDNRSCPDGGMVAFPALPVSEPEMAMFEPDVPAETQLMPPSAPKPQSPPTRTETAIQLTGTPPASSDAEVVGPPRPVAFSDSPETVSAPVRRPTPPSNEKSRPTTPFVSDAARARAYSGTGLVTFEMVPRRGFSVQVIACVSEQSAQVVRQQCLQMFEGNLVALVPPSRDNLYRVMVGYFGVRPEAERLKTQLRNSFSDAFVREWTRR